MTTLLQSKKGTSTLEQKHGIEIFEVIFVDHPKRQAKNMILQIAPKGGWFPNSNQLFSFERAATIMDGTKKETFSVDIQSEIVVNTPIGAIVLTANKAKMA